MSKSVAKVYSHSQTVFPIPESVIRHHGQTALFAPMREWHKQNRFPPVLLITGANGLGKRTLGYFLAQWILCENTGFTHPAEESLSLFGEVSGEQETSGVNGASETPMPCGQCPSCARSIKGSWVDFIEITPNDEESEVLKIDQFRELKSKAGFGAHEGAYRIILIPNSDHMTIQAANSMLKLLEEPPTGWIFILTASDPTLLLPTIVSRCQAVRLKPFATTELQGLLSHSGIAPEKAKICAELAHGSWGRAWELTQDDLWERRKSVFDFLRDPSGMLNSILDWAALSSRHFNFLVDHLELLTFDLLQWSLAPQGTHPTWLNQDASAVLVSHAQLMLKTSGSLEQARQFWVERAERLAQARQESSAPLNRKILVQDLLLPWLNAIQRA